MLKAFKRRAPVVIALLASAGCAAILGIDDTTDLPADVTRPNDRDGTVPPEVDGAIDAPPDVGDGGAQPEAGPSCASLAKDCAGARSCCESSLVPGGTFLRSYDAVLGGGYLDAGFPATVAPFRLDRFEATVGRFRKFAAAGLGTQANPPAAGAGANPNLAGSGWDDAFIAWLPANASSLASTIKCPNTNWTDAPGASETMPMTCLPWALAFAFCVWDGGRLPTEAEWNFAASAGADQRSYPWSVPSVARAIDDTYAVYNGLTRARAVGSKSPKGDSKHGLSDLAGNAWEWTLDVHAEPYPTTSCVNCANLGISAFRVARGGAYGYFAQHALTGYRFRADGSGGAFADFGVRCARSP